MSRNINVFISYRNIENSRIAAQELHNHLTQDYGYDVFWDYVGLKPMGGAEWADLIYDKLRFSDVLIVLLEKETAESHWVQREVDVARGANVRILPVALVEDVQVRVDEVMKHLALTDLQYLKYDPANPDIEAIGERIKSLSKYTRKSQKTWYEKLHDFRRTRPVDEENPSFKRFRLQDYPEVKTEIHLATGDISCMPGIDVIVNTENNYMQMARIFETYTVSSTLRRKGSHIVFGFIHEDSVQKHLDLQLEKSIGINGRPIPIEQVIVTSAGHPESELVKDTNVRYIFHAATVQVHPNTRKITPVPPPSIEQSVINCLEKVLKVDDLQGVISPPGTPYYDAEQEIAAAYTPISRIIFPFFGTGHGGSPINVVVPAMLAGFKRFLIKHRNDAKLKLVSIHLCIYSQYDVGDVVKMMSDEFEVIQ